jgi:[acyl-carrier-protein] S-malonyltransferase
MGRDLYENFASARAVFDQADEVLGISLSQLCFEGPEDELRNTVNAQPAVVAVGLACLEAVRDAAPNALPPAAYIAGHSVGEYTALIVAGVVDFATGLRMARTRGELMAEAGRDTPGTMCAIIGLDEGQLAGVCRRVGVWMANINAPGQIVISGEVSDVADAAALAKSEGATIAIPLAVSGAFHTPLMRSAADRMYEVVTDQPMAPATIPVVGNITAEPLGSADEVRIELRDQICRGVQWQRSVEFLIAHGVSNFLEFGPGEVLSGLIGYIDSAATTTSIGDATSVSKMAEMVGDRPGLIADR